MSGLPNILVNLLRAKRKDKEKSYSIMVIFTWVNIKKENLMVKGNSHAKTGIVISESLKKVSNMEMGRNSMQNLTLLMREISITIKSMAQELTESLDCNMTASGFMESNKDLEYK